MDKPDANPDRVKNEMAELGIMPEEWGGDTIFVPTSAKKGDGIEDLLETILTVADVKELKADPTQIATGTVIEAKLDKGRGPVATLLVQNGTLHQGDPIVVGTAFGRVRKMIDEHAKELKEAGLLSGGSLFKKSRLDLSKVNASAFEKIDIRRDKTFKIPAKKVSVLTQMPSGSYEIKQNTDGTSTLTVTDANRFWSVSNFLVVSY
jgi:translation initiation factor IF-2